ncbi:acyltransferase family protein [Nocardioides lianchengensis]|uniref:acyltransferase family protein n=1 Tax=Nocardioides lianchengensis TaxID=1045774 RepID=UPI00147B773B|nr:acyltransferase [Nocardioides lianchengensis]NYG10427.1 peptidoglycan/LPS O-acetylase OafA/YrhL [Nocardioides lianchengensis]
MRGIAVVLVVLSHLWRISPWMLQRMFDARDGTGSTGSQFLGYLFSAGNYAVSIFFVIGAFLATRAMLRQLAAPTGLLPGVTLVRRFTRLSGQLYFLLLAFVVWTAIEKPVDDGRSTTGSVISAATYTWNFYIHDQMEAARGDLGHLWYLSVDFQMFLVVLLLVWLLRRRPQWLVIALGALWVALLFWRAQTYDFDPFWALLRTGARGDAPVAGALAAAAMPYLRSHAHWGRPALLVGLGSLVPLLFWTEGSEAYFGLPGVSLDVALVLVVVGATLATPPRWVIALVGSRPLAFLGRHSLSLYLWHLPMIFLVSRHTEDWREPVRVALALFLTLVCVLVSELLVERRVQRFLDSPRWRETDQGLLRFAVRTLDRRLSPSEDAQKPESDRSR